MERDCQKGRATPELSRMREAIGESVLLNLLTNRPDRKDTRVFAHAAAETQTVVHEAYQTRPDSAGGGLIQEAGFLEVFPRVASRPPKLLQELEALLVDRLRNNDKAVSTAPLVTKDRDPGMSANLCLDAHRHVFGAFIEGFSTYTALLAAVQEDFEAALDQGVSCAMENVTMRLHIASEEARRQKAQSELRSRIMAGELEHRKGAFARLQELKIRMDRAVKRASIAEREVDSLKQNEQRMKDLVAKLQAQQQSLQELQQQEARWAAMPNSGTMGTLQVGALSAEDEVWLEQEYSSSVKPMEGGEGRMPAKEAAER